MLLPTLFDKSLKIGKNIIPHGGEAIYHGAILTEKLADEIFHTLLENTPWRNDEWQKHGKYHLTPRKVAWYGPQKKWPDILSELREKVEAVTGVPYAHVLLNLYGTGEIGIGWHCDEESQEEDSSIASVSLGAERRFDFRHNNTKEKISIVLEHGSLLVMQGLLQNFWQHHLPKSKKVFSPRINLTFRK